MGNMARNFNGKRYNTNKQYKIEISQDMLYSLLLYSASQHSLITKKGLSNLGKLLELVDEKLYENTNFDSYIVLKVTKSLIKLQLEKKLTSLALLKQNILDEYPNEELVGRLFDEYIELEEVVAEEIAYVNKFVEERLTYSYMFKYREEFKIIFDELDRTDNLENLNARFVNTIERAFSDVKQAKADSDCVVNDFDMFDDNKAETVVQKTIEELNKPNNKIHMGIKKLNEMFNGGLKFLAHLKLL